MNNKLNAELKKYKNLESKFVKEAQLASGERLNEAQLQELLTAVANLIQSNPVRASFVDYCFFKYSVSIEKE